MPHALSLTSWLTSHGYRTPPGLRYSCDVRRQNMPHGPSHRARNAQHRRNRRSKSTMHKHLVTIAALAAAVALEFPVVVLFVVVAVVDRL
ncbi:hypothetical protein NECAME_06268 [Necator americanus]|uniref:Uncharacterized protein n=1 Tax=Necator americanus TaxID=51031 RepID=W2TVU5_NECAM|nr:hypothetical protein NECAME_06268 [Necator americanus]ETN85754.1 hypothetical protein NECAME_06268 [Necator americanus]